MTRNARYKLNLLSLSLGIDLSILSFVEIITGVWNQQDVRSFGPDREFAAHENILKIGRYRQVRLREDLRQMAVSSPVQ